MYSYEKQKLGPMIFNTGWGYTTQWNQYNILLPCYVVGENKTVGQIYLDVLLLLSTFPKFKSSKNLTIPWGHIRGVVNGSKGIGHMTVIVFPLPFKFSKLKLRIENTPKGKTSISQKYP